MFKESPLKKFCDHNQTWYCNHIVPNGGQGILLQVCLRIERFRCLGEEEKKSQLARHIIKPLDKFVIKKKFKEKAPRQQKRLKLE